MALRPVSSSGFANPSPIIPDASVRPLSRKMGLVQTAKVIRFSGTAMKRAGRNGVWVTVERFPAKEGGLGEVSKTIPAAIKKFSDKDIRIMMPYLRPLKEEGGFESTGLVKQLIICGQLETFELMQKRETDTGSWVYAIANDKWFGRHKNLYHKGAVEGVGEDAIFKSMMVFNRAAALFLPELNSSAPHPLGSRLARFDGDADFVIANDWHTGPLLYELPESYKVGKLFMLHNTFDGPRKQVDAFELGMKVPPFFTYVQPGYGAFVENYSPLSLGIEAADAVIANNNYVHTITRTRYAEGQQFVKYLEKKVLQNRILNMHHALSDEYNPYNNPALKTNGFTELKRQDSPIAQYAEMERYKKTNKLALQRAFKLKEDPNAVVFNWIARFDPNQKGFYILMAEAEDFLKKHPQVQLIIAGSCNNNAEPEKKFIKAWIDRMNSIPEFKGRLYLPNEFVDNPTVNRINAGSDFQILPSLYEPYGLVQLESTNLACIPIVHGVDGLRTTVSDPALNGKDGNPNKETVWNYGQTGILMKPINVPAYMSTLGRQAQGWNLTEKEKEKRYLKLSDDEVQVIREARTNLRDAMERALKLSSDPKQMFEVRSNGMRFVEEQHRWEPIVRRYENLINWAIKRSQTFTNGEGATDRFSSFKRFISRLMAGPHRLYQSCVTFLSNLFSSPVQ